MPLLLCLMLLGQTTQPATTAAAGPLTSGDPKVDAILERLETKGRTVADLICNVTYEDYNVIDESRRKKTGQIIFKRQPPSFAFLIRFDKMNFDGVIKTSKEWYGFDGTWFTEARASTRQVIKRQVVREGEQIDPFSLSKGPFRLPFGQEKDEILRNFDVSLAAPAQGDPPNTDHLVCVPKPAGAMGDEYQKLEFWIDRKAELPVKMVAHRKDETVVTTTFSRLSINSSPPGSLLKIKVPGDWAVTVERLPPAPPTP